MDSEPSKARQNAKFFKALQDALIKLINVSIEFNNSKPIDSDRLSLATPKIYKQDEDKFFWLSREAEKCLVKIQILIFDLIPSHQVSLQNSNKQIEYVVYEFYESNLLPCSLNSAKLFIQRVWERLKATLHTTIQFLPCILFNNTDPDNFSIGPVTFITTDKCLGEVVPEKIYSTHFSELSDSSVLIFEDKQGITKKEFIEKFSEYAWIGSIKIRDCDTDLAQSKAAEAVSSCLHILQFLFGRHAAQNIRLAGADAEASFQTLYTLEDGSFHYKIFKKSRKGIKYQNWYKYLTEERAYELNICGKAIENCLIIDTKQDPLLECLRQALKWFSKTTMEESYTSALMHFSVCLEWLLFHKIGSQVGKNFPIRLKHLFDRYCQNSSDKWVQIAKNLYDCRSQIVHGGEVNKDFSLYALMINAESLCIAGIRCWVRFYQDVLRKHECTMLSDVNDKALKKIFNYLNNLDDAFDFPPSSTFKLNV